MAPMAPPYLNCRWIQDRLGSRWLQDRYSGVVIDIAAYKAQYFAIPKVACSSIMAALVNLLGIEFPAGEWKPELFQTNKWDHLFPRDKVVLTKRQALRIPISRWRFAFVRNPWDRLVSCYSEKIREDGDEENFSNGISKILLPFGVFKAGMSFEDFALAASRVPDERADPHWRSQFTFLVDYRRRLPMNFLGTFENIDRDVQRVSRHIGVHLDIPHLLRSNRTHYRDYYSSKLRDLIGQRYEGDIQLFRYTF